MRNVLLHAAMTCFAIATGLAVFCAASPLIWPDAAQGRLFLLTWKEMTTGIALFAVGSVLLRLYEKSEPKP